jgi:hypothetical protein
MDITTLPVNTQCEIEKLVADIRRICGAAPSIFTAGSPKTGG